MAKPSIAALKVLAGKIAEEINRKSVKKDIPFEKLPLELQKTISQMNVIKEKAKNLREEEKLLFKKLEKSLVKHSLVEEFYIEENGHKNYNKKAYYKTDTCLKQISSINVYEELLLLTNFSNRDIESIKKEIIAKFTK